MGYSEAEARKEIETIARRLAASSVLKAEAQKASLPEMHGNTLEDDIDLLDQIEKEAHERGEILNRTGGATLISRSEIPASPETVLNMKSAIWDVARLVLQHGISYDKDPELRDYDPEDDVEGSTYRNEEIYVSADVFSGDESVPHLIISYTPASFSGVTVDFYCFDYNGVPNYSFELEVEKEDGTTLRHKSRSLPTDELENIAANEAVIASWALDKVHEHLKAL